MIILVNDIEQRIGIFDLRVEQARALACILNEGRRHANPFVRRVMETKHLTIHSWDGERFVRLSMPNLTWKDVFVMENIIIDTLKDQPDRRYGLETVLDALYAAVESGAGI